MTIPVWPLNDLAISGTWTVIPQPDIRETDYGIGPDAMQARVNRLIHQMQFDMILSNTDFLTFSTFWVYDLEHGVNKFTMPVWDGEVYQTAFVRAYQPYTTRDYALDSQQVTLYLTVLTLPVLSGAAVYMVETYGADNTHAWSNQLDLAMDVNWEAALDDIFNELTYMPQIPWNSYTPVVTSQSGILTSASATGRWARINTTIFITITVAITTNGTGAGGINCTLPTGQDPTLACTFNGTNPTIWAGRDLTNGKSLNGVITTNGPPGVVRIRNYDNSYPGADGETLSISGFYDANP